jgi:hypothetical protein
MQMSSIRTDILLDANEFKFQGNMTYATILDGWNVFLVGVKLVSTRPSCMYATFLVSMRPSCKYATFLVDVVATGNKLHMCRTFATTLIDHRLLLVTKRSFIYSAVMSSVDATFTSSVDATFTWMKRSHYS